MLNETILQSNSIRNSGSAPASSPPLPSPPGLQPLHHNPYTEPLWRAAVAQYERGMAPAELRIAGKLRSKFHHLEAQPHQLLREFQRYRELVRRPSISKELIPER